MTRSPIELSWTAKKQRSSHTTPLEDFVPNVFNHYSHALPYQARHAVSVASSHGCESPRHRSCQTEQRFADQFHPLIEGQSFPIVVMGLTRVGANETALEFFVRMPYESDPATLDMEDLIGLHRFSKHYLISGLEADILASIQSFQISLDSLSHYMTEVMAEPTFANPGLLKYLKSNQESVC